MSEEPMVELAAVENSFKNACRSFAESFLQTVVVIDDEAYIKEPEAEPEVLKAPDPRGKTNSDDTEDASTTVTADAETEETNDKPTDQTVEGTSPRRPSAENELDAKQLVASFAERGLVCAVLTPDKVENLSTSFVSVARRSDITIVDWLINKDDGNLARSIVKEILELDLSLIHI